MQFVTIYGSIKMVRPIPVHSVFPSCLKLNSSENRTYTNYIDYYLFRSCPSSSQKYMCVWGYILLYTDTRTILV